MGLPFDGAISAFHEIDAPDDIRKAIEIGRTKDILSDSYPYDAAMDKGDYEEEIEALQLELVRLQADVKETGKRLERVLVDAFAHCGVIRIAVRQDVFHAAVRNGLADVIRRLGFMKRRDCAVEW